MIALLGLHVFLTKTLGQTPGKMVLGLQVVSAQEFVPPSNMFPQILWASALLRFVGFGLGCAFLVPFMFGPLSRRRRTFHDWISGTRVVQVRARSRPSARRPVIFIACLFIPVLSAGYLFFRQKPSFKLNTKSSSMPRALDPVENNK